MKPFDLELLRAEPRARRPLIALAALSVVQGLCAVGQAFAIATLVVAVVRGDALMWPAVAVVAAYGIRALAAGAAERVAAWAATRVANLLRDRAVRRWLSLPVEERPSESAMLARATSGAQAVEPYVSRYLPALVAAGVVPVLAIIALLATDWISALIVVLTLPLLPIFAALIGQHTQEQTAAKQRELDRLTEHFLDVMRGLPTLVSYQRAEHQVSVVREVGERHRRVTVRTLRIAFLSSAALELLATIAVAIVAVAVGLRLVHGDVGLWVGLVAILLAPEAYWPIRRVGQEFHSAADGATALDDLLEVGVATPGTPPAAETPAVHVRALSYRYPGTDREVLRDVALERTGPGVIAVVGPSGAGKSTLLELVAGLRTPTSGEVDRPVQVHLVTQRPFIVPGTLRENLTIGADVRAPGDSALADVLPDALQDLPDGLDTMLGDDGFGLSAGQRAALALTRARLSDAPLIALDEPTAHLDQQAQGEVHRFVEGLARDRIVLIATHSGALSDAADQQLRLVDPTPTGLDRGAREASIVRRLPTAQPQPVELTDAHSAVDTTRHSIWRPAPGVLSAAALGAAASACGVALTATSGWLIVEANTRPPVLALLVAIVCVRAFGIGRPVLRYAERVRSHDAALGDLTSRRASLFARLIPLTPARLGRRRRADLLTGAVADLDDEVDLQVRALVPLIAAAATSALAVVVAAFIVPMAGLVLAGLVLLACAIAWLDHRLELSGHPQSLAARGEVHRATQTIVTNMSAVQSISAQPRLLANLDSAQSTAGRAAGTQVRGRALGIGLSTALTGVAAVVMAFVAHAALRDGAVDEPIAALLVLGPLALADLLGTLPDAVGAAARARSARRRIAALSDQEPAVRERATGDTARRIAVRPALRLENLEASWDGQQRDLSIDELALAPGERVAVTGPNGAGKSTLLAVLARQLDPTAGSYDLDGTDMRVLDLTDTRSRFAIVDDEPHVFGGTVRANLLLARPEATERQLTDALRCAGLERWAAALPEGIDTEVGAGRDLSGGERTRMSIARAILSGRPVLLLDEPVAHLDSPTAREVMTDLHAATAGASVVAVTHQALGELGADRVIGVATSPATGGTATVAS